MAERSAEIVRGSAKPASAEWQAQSELTALEQ